MENQQENRANQNYERRNNRTMIYIILIALLVCANIYLYVKYNQKETMVVKEQEKIAKDSMNIVDLDAKYTAAYNEVESLKGQNATLDSLVTVKEGEIKKMKERLDAAVRNNKISKEEYQKQLDNLQQLVDNLKTQIVQLEKEKGILIVQKDSIGKELNTKVVENDKLKKENTIVSRKAGLLNAANITGTGVLFKGSKNKEKETTSAKKVQKIKVCFDADKTPAPDAGTKTFLIRIINPQGVTLAVQSQGSGVFDLSETGEKMQFTTKQDIQYKQQKQNVCIYWGASTSGFEKGKYTAEIYQDGYKIGSKEFTFK